MNLTEALAAFYSNSPRLIEGMELDGWNGIEGTGYIAETDELTCIVMDVTDTGVTVEAHTFIDDSYTESEIQTWILAVTGVINNNG